MIFGQIEIRKLRLRHIKNLSLLLDLSQINSNFSNFHVIFLLHVERFTFRHKSTRVVCVDTLYRIRRVPRSDMKGKSFLHRENNTNNNFKKEEVILLCYYKFNIWPFLLHWRSNKLGMYATWSTFISKIRLSKIEFLFLRVMGASTVMSFIP